MAENKEPRVEKDIGQIVRYLTSTFNQALTGLERPHRGKNGANLAYKLQTEFAYRLNEVMQGPRCVLQRNIAECNAFIDETIQSLNEGQEAAA